MPADLSAYKVARGDGNASAPFDALVQTVQDALNAIGGPNTAFGPGLVFDPAQLQQGLAGTGDWLQYNAGLTTWVTATPPATTMVVLSDKKLSSSAASFDFPAIPGSYKHLRLVGLLHSDRSSGPEDLAVQFNGDTAASRYDGYSLGAQDTGPTWDAQEARAGSAAVLGNTVESDETDAKRYSTVELTIPHYAGTANNTIFTAKLARSKGTAGTLNVYTGMGAWRSSAAVTRVTLTCGHGSNFKAGSRVTLYGF